MPKAPSKTRGGTAARQGSAITLLRGATPSNKWSLQVKHTAPSSFASRSARVKRSSRVMRVKAKASQMPAHMPQRVQSSVSMRGVPFSRESAPVGHTAWHRVQPEPCGAVHHDSKATTSSRGRGRYHLLLQSRFQRGFLHRLCHWIPARAPPREPTLWRRSAFFRELRKFHARKRRMITFGHRKSSDSRFVVAIAGCTDLFWVLRHQIPR